MEDAVRARSLEEAEAHLRSLTVRVGLIEAALSDHAQRFDTLQTPWLKRVWFALNGWPWYDLNAPAPKARPWHRWVRP